MGNSNIKIDKNSAIAKQLMMPTNIYVSRDIKYLEYVKKKIAGVLEKNPDYFIVFGDFDDDLGMSIIVDNLVLDIYDYIASGQKNHLSNEIVLTINEIIKKNHLEEQKQNNPFPASVQVAGGSGQMINSNLIMNVIKRHDDFMDLLNKYYNHIDLHV